MDPRSFVKAEESTLLGTFEVSNGYMINFYCGYSLIKYRDVVCTSLIIIFDIIKLQNVVTFMCVFHHLTPLNFSPALCILWIHEICICYLKMSLMSDVQYMYVCQHAIILIPTKPISHLVNPGTYIRPWLIISIRNIKPIHFNSI